MKIIIISLFALLIVVPLIHRIFEIILISVNSRFFIGVGIRIFKKQVKFDENIPVPGEKVRIRKKTGNYVFTETGGIYIYPKLFWAGFYNVRTSFALRMYGMIKKDIVDLDVKISAFTVIYSLLFMAGLIVFTVWSVMTGQDLIISLMGGILFLVVLVSFIQPLFAVEDNYNSMIMELKTIVKNGEQIRKDTA
jgi:hypothetical protein